MFSKSKFNIFRSVDGVLFERQQSVFALMGKVLLLASVLLSSPQAMGSHEVPKSIDGAEIVSAESLLDAVLTHSQLVIIDARHKADRKQGYIESSISLPDTNANCDSLAEIIPSYENPVTFFCNGVMCARSANAINKAVACGYKKIYWLRGGFNEWKAQGFPYLSK